MEHKEGGQLVSVQVGIPTGLRWSPSHMFLIRPMGEGAWETQDPSGGKIVHAAW